MERCGPTRSDSFQMWYLHYVDGIDGTACYIWDGIWDGMNLARDSSDLRLAFISQQQLRSFNLPYQFGYTNVPEVRLGLLSGQVFDADLNMFE